MPMMELNQWIGPGYGGVLGALLLGLAAGVLLGRVWGRRPKNKAEGKAAPEDSTPQSAGVRYAVHQDIGSRQDQQDSYGVSEPGGYEEKGVLALMADGMGGLQNGKAVSSALVYSFLNYFRMHADKENPQLLLLEMAAQANDHINQMLRGSEPGGSTLLSAIVRNGALYFLTVGDSRIYLYRQGRLIQLNREHTLREMLALLAVNHEAPIEQGLHDPQRDALTSYFGGGQLSLIDRNQEGIPLAQGDRILLLSDGVFRTLSCRELESALQCSIEEAAGRIGQMIREAENPHQDNSTALILEYLG